MTKISYVIAVAFGLLALAAPTVAQPEIPKLLTHSIEGGYLDDSQAQTQAPVMEAVSAPSQVTRKNSKLSAKSGGASKFKVGVANTGKAAKSENVKHGAHVAAQDGVITSKKNFRI